MRSETATYEEVDDFIRVKFRIEVHHISYFGPNELAFVATGRYGSRGFYVHPSQKLALDEKRENGDLNELELSLTYERDPSIVDKLTCRTLWWPRTFTTEIVHEDDDPPKIVYMVGFHAPMSFATPPPFIEKDYRTLEAATLKAAREGKHFLFKPEIRRIGEHRGQLELKF